MQITEFCAWDSCDHFLSDDHLSLGCGSKQNDHSLISGGLLGVEEALSAAAEAQVGTHVGSEPHGVGGHHDGVKVLDKV